MGDGLREKMVKLFRRERKAFKEDIPTRDFANSFPGMTSSCRQIVVTQDKNNGPIYANDELLDFIVRQDDFWIKYIQTAEKIEDCSMTVKLIKEVLNAHESSCRRPSKELTHGQDPGDTGTSTIAARLQKKKENALTAKYSPSEHTEISQPSDVQFSSKDVLMNLGKSTEKATPIQPKQEEGIKSFPSAFHTSTMNCESNMNQAAEAKEHGAKYFSLNRLSNNPENRTHHPEKKDYWDISKASFEIKNDQIRSDICETHSEDDSESFVLSESEVSMAFPEAKDLGAEYFSLNCLSNIPENLTHHPEKKDYMDISKASFNIKDDQIRSDICRTHTEDDSESFVLSESEVSMAFPDQSCSPEIDSLKEKKKENLHMIEEENPSEPDDKADENIRMEEHLNFCSADCQTVPLPGNISNENNESETILENLNADFEKDIKGEDIESEQLSPEPLPARDSDKETSKTHTELSTHSAAGIASAVSENKQSMNIPYYNNCLFINASNVQMDAKHCNMNAKSQSKKPQRNISACDMKFRKSSSMDENFITEVQENNVNGCNLVPTSSSNEEADSSFNRPIVQTETSIEDNTIVGRGAHRMGPMAKDKETNVTRSVIPTPSIELENVTEDKGIRVENHDVNTEAIEVGERTQAEGGNELIPSAEESQSQSEEFRRPTFERNGSNSEYVLPSEEVTTNTGGTNDNGGLQTGSRNEVGNASAGIHNDEKNQDHAVGFQLSSYLPDWFRFDYLSFS